MDPPGGLMAMNPMGRISKRESPTKTNRSKCDDPPIFCGPQTDVPRKFVFLMVRKCTVTPYRCSLPSRLLKTTSRGEDLVHKAVFTQDHGPVS